MNEYSHEIGQFGNGYSGELYCDWPILADIQAKAQQSLDFSNNIFQQSSVVRLRHAADITCCGEK